MDNANRLVGMETKITNIMLVEAIRQLKENENPDTTNSVIDEVVMRAKFLMPVTVKEGKMEFNMVTNASKQNYFVAFTDWEEMRSCISGPEQKAMVMTFDDYAMIMKNNNQTEGFVINPFSSNLIFKRDYVKQLFDKKVEILTKE